MLEPSVTARIFHLPNHFIFVPGNFRRNGKKKEKGFMLNM
jgi:hypothetical protein